MKGMAINKAKMRDLPVDLPVDFFAEKPADKCSKGYIVDSYKIPNWYL